MKLLSKLILHCWHSLLLLFSLVGPIYIITRILNNSLFNTLSELKNLDFSQVLIGLAYLLTLMFYLWSLALTIEFYIKKYYPNKTKLMYAIFKKINRYIIPFFITTWALLSLRESHFNYLTTILATAALLADISNKNIINIFPKPEGGFSIVRKGRKYYILQSKPKRRLYKIKRTNRAKN